MIAWWNPSPTMAFEEALTYNPFLRMIANGEIDMASKFDHDGDGKDGGSLPKVKRGKAVPLTRGNLERAEQLARRAADYAAAMLKSITSDDVSDWAEGSNNLRDIKASLADALTELGE